MDQDLPPKMKWTDIRLLAFDGARVTFILQGEELARVHAFASREEMRAAVAEWFRNDEAG